MHLEKEKKKKTLVDCNRYCEIRYPSKRVYNLFMELIL